MARMNDKPGNRPGDKEQRAAQLAAFPNLGPKSAAMLAGAGITSPTILRQLGAVAAFSKVRAAGYKPSLNLLWALEGGLTGVHWRVVAREHRTSLLLALEAFAKPS